MPPTLIFDLAGIDLQQILFGPDDIRACNPQRGAMEHLSAIVWADEAAARIVGYKDVHADEFWVPGHIPGRPLLPGVIMLEAAAQLASFYNQEVYGMGRLPGLWRSGGMQIPRGRGSRAAPLPAGRAGVVSSPAGSVAECRAWLTASSRSKRGSSALRCNVHVSHRSSRSLCVHLSQTTANHR